MRVVQWNVRRFSDACGVSQVAAVAERLVRLNPSFVALNEVDLSLRPNALEELSEALGMHYAFFGHAREGAYGNALLARTPIDATHRVELDGGTVVTHRGNPHRINRGLLSCETRWHGRPLRVAVTHLDHMCESQRALQATSVVRSLGTCAQGPTLLLGDLNALTRRDYSAFEWAAHAEHNEAQGWAPPRDGAQSGGSLSTLFEAGFRDTVAEVLAGPTDVEGRVEGRVAGGVEGGDEGGVEGGVEEGVEGGVEEGAAPMQWSSPPWTLISNGPRYRIDFVLLRSTAASSMKPETSRPDGETRGAVGGKAEEECWLEPRAARVEMDSECPSDHAPVVVDFRTALSS